MARPTKRSWQRVAEMLAARVANYNFCPENHKPMRADCPFCADMKAFQAYKDKVIQMKRNST